MHDATKVLLGSTGSSAKESSAHASDPADFLAGTAVRLKSTGALSVTEADGKWLGVSLGKSLSDHKKTAVCRDGESVPVKCTELAQAEVQIGDILFKAVARGVGGNDIHIVLSDDVSDASAEVTDITSGVITISIEDGATTAADIAAAVAASAEAAALVTAIVDTGEEATAQNAAADTPLADGGVEWIVIGEKVYIDDVTGLANDPDETVTISDAIYTSGRLTGVNEDSSEAACALCDMPGGL